MNPIQSIVFDAAYNSSENLLICAPTGAGKTNTAMLTVIRLIREHLNEDFVLDLKAFKIVYMAPMKALAAEMTATFSKRLSPLGIKVRECTGDMQLSKQEIMDTQMLVTTPEKWDVISRKGAGDASLVMVFVHARGETSKTARWIRDAASQRGDLASFQPLTTNTVDLFKRLPHCHDATTRELAVEGIACHHAGMLRPDRRLVEQLFSNRVIRVLVCTATLAWGVNLPAHAVIIKGTKIYDADKSDFVDLDILDVVQVGVELCIHLIYHAT
ncbi:unnamed protein product [Dibothriocephalus latus]|uniref:Helicase ATP-binding domain-containing protein n=1 Tax=Dibothriocephalus latus TaxID=60516 RepID=A0A3P7Q3K0_DIBLA|nr:unnamed protein product [Dibothriocephalus latus]